MTLAPGGAFAELALLLGITAVAGAVATRLRQPVLIACIFAGILAGLTVAQMSEFSIVFVAVGITLGHVGMEASGLTTRAGLVTIALATYMMLYAQRLYERLSPWLGPFEHRVPFREIAVDYLGEQLARQVLGRRDAE